MSSANTASEHPRPSALPYLPSVKLVPHVWALSPYRERTLSPRSFRTGWRSVLGTTLEYCTHAARSRCPSGPERTEAHVCPASLGADSLLGQGRVVRIQDHQRDVRDCCGETR